ncbi:MAG: hypothetical protein CMH26_02850 [Micavibrio sp.]|nr:hypothetical protein [Micavibrio sp.]|tara:strand:+ start:1107 stop:1673 length:567 start_codon:yes stop_codon:yes gene_type:complete
MTQSNVKQTIQLQRDFELVTFVPEGAEPRRSAGIKQRFLGIHQPHGKRLGDDSAELQVLDGVILDDDRIFVAELLPKGNGEAGSRIHYVELNFKTAAGHSIDLNKELAEIILPAEPGFKRLGNTYKYLSDGFYKLDDSLLNGDGLGYVALKFDNDLGEGALRLRDIRAPYQHGAASINRTYVQQNISL